MNFIDRMFLLWYSMPAMAAAMPAGMLYFSILCFPLGLASYANTFVAQYRGAGREKRVGVAVGQAMRLGLYGTPLFLLVSLPAPYLFRFSGHDPTIVALEVVYFQVLMFGAGAAVIAAAQASFFTGLGKTRVVMLVDTSSAALNMLLDYLWIFGHWGFTEMGIEGAGWATVVALWWKVGMYALIMEMPRFRNVYGLRSGRKFDWPLFKRMLHYGAPNGLQLFVDVTAITLFIMLIGFLGERAMVASTLAFNVNSIAFVPILGVGIAVSTMVGQQLGRNRPDLASRATYSAYVIAMIYTGFMGILYVAIPEFFLMAHASGATGSGFTELQELAVLLLRFVALYCLFDATAIVFVSAIKGAGDTRFVLITTAVTSLIPIAGGFVGVKIFGWGLMWCWVVVTLWICSVGVIYFLRFVQGKWKTMRVIESEVVPDLALLDVEPCESIAV